MQKHRWFCPFSSRSAVATAFWVGRKTKQWESLPWHDSSLLQCSWTLHVKYTVHRKPSQWLIPWLTTLMLADKRHQDTESHSYQTCSSDHLYIIRPISCYPIEHTCDTGLLEGWSSIAGEGGWRRWVSVYAYVLLIDKLSWSWFQKVGLLRTFVLIFTKLAGAGTVVLPEAPTIGGWQANNINSAWPN